MNESNAQKASANKLFASSRFSEAIGEYDRALASCPNYLDYEVAVLKSNIAACHIKLEEWKEAVESATTALKGLERIDPLPKSPAKTGEGKESAEEKDQQVVELDDDDEEADKELEKLKLSDERKLQIANLRAKSYLRRARGNTEQGGWGNLVAAEEG